MSKNCLLALVAVAFLTLGGCMGHRSVSGVIGYKNQRVVIKDAGSYTVGELSSDWQFLKVGVKAVAFHHRGLGATLSTDAFCGKGFDDFPLKTLTANLLAGVERGKVLSQAEFNLDGRAAQRTVSSGFVDGVQVQLDTVVIKKNNCTFDFICVVPPYRYSEAAGDFERFYSGFHYE